MCSGGCDDSGSIPDLVCAEVLRYVQYSTYVRTSFAQWVANNLSPSRCVAGGAKPAKKEHMKKMILVKGAN